MLSCCDPSLLASDNEYSKYPRVVSVDDLAILGEPRSTEESLILRTLANEFVIRHLSNEMFKIGSILNHNSDTLKERLEECVLEIKTLKELQDKKIGLQQKKIESLEQLHVKIEDRQNQKIKKLKTEVKKQKIIITGLIITTYVLACYTIAKKSFIK